MILYYEQPQAMSKIDKLQDFCTYDIPNHIRIAKYCQKQVQYL